MNSADSFSIPESRLAEFARDLLTAAGLADDEAAVVADALVESNLCGHDSHGVIQIPG